ncbi:MAG TPA: hypothetical protein VFN76_02155 [Candidatus Limnocylindria bacterium]|nr:hypothetical protein [Candidatus Limnocylindria bacterium]
MNTQLTLARTVYVVIGVVALLAGIGPVVASLTSGCQIAFDQSSLRIDMNAATCITYLNPLGAIAGAVIGALVLSAAFWFDSTGRVRRLLGQIGIAIGALATLTPAALLLAIFDFSGMSSPGVVDYLIGIVPIVIGALAAAILWRHENRREVAVGA